MPDLLKVQSCALRKEVINSIYDQARTQCPIGQSDLLYIFLIFCLFINSDYLNVKQNIL